MHNYATNIRNREKRRVQMQDTGDAIAIENNNLKQSYIYMCIYVYIYTHSYQNFRIIANQKSTTDTEINKKNQLKYNTKHSHQTPRGENKRRREEKRATKTNQKQLIKWQEENTYQ